MLNLVHRPTCPESAALWIPLAAREKEILDALAHGHKTGAIAQTLCLSVKTIETYLERIKEKRGLPTVEAVRAYAVYRAVYGRGYSPSTAATP